MRLVAVRATVILSEPCPFVSPDCGSVCGVTLSLGDLIPTV